MSNRQKSKPRLNPGCLGKFAGAGAPVFKEEPGFAGARAPAFKEEPGFAEPGPRSSKIAGVCRGRGPGRSLKLAEFVLQHIYVNKYILCTYCNSR